MIIYRTAQRIITYGGRFTRISIFSDSQVAIKSLSNVANNSRIVRECRRYTNLFSGLFSVKLIWVHGYCDILGNCRADELAGADALISNASSINMGMPLTSFKPAIAQKFF